jgi:hypothetical protein
MKIGAFFLSLHKNLRPCQLAQILLEMQFYL